MTPGLSSKCGKPHCDEQGTKTYRDENGNSITLCDEHYYQAVTGRGMTVSRVVQSDDDVDETLSSWRRLFG